MTSFLDPLAPYIPLFGVDHLLALGTVLATLILLLVFRRRVRDHAGMLRRAFLVLALAQQVALYWYQAAVAGWDWGDSAPLHISRVTTLVLVAYLVTGRRAVLEVGFYLGLYAYATFLYPQRIQPMDHLMGWSFLVSHAVTILVPLFAGIAYGWRPTVRGLWRAYGWFIAYFGVVLAVNAVTDGNYFYLKYRPFLRDLPEPLYWLAACAATLALMWIGYAVSRRFPVRRDAGYATETAAMAPRHLSARV
ncbi:TIGR02206 family membrane protein [Cellulosimicrobium funkei]|nr:TIGR02206 family membrane protein [Cellulosimicrobium funkei]